MQSINKFLNEKLSLNNKSTLKTDGPYTPTQGEHDSSRIYDDIWNDIKDDLERWGAGPVHGWNGSEGVAFSISKGKRLVDKDDWIVIRYNKEYDDFTIFLVKYGDIDDTKNIKAKADMVYAGQESEIIDEILGIKK